MCFSITFISFLVSRLKALNVDPGKLHMEFEIIPQLCCTVCTNTSQRNLRSQGHQQVFAIYLAWCKPRDIQGHSTQGLLEASQNAELPLEQFLDAFF